MELGANGLPVFRRDPAVAPRIPSLQELLELEHTTLATEDQQRARQELLAATPADPWLWCRATQQNFLRLASTAATFRSCGVERATNADAMAALEQWLALRQVAFVEEPPGVMAHWARLAAVDRDFRGFQPQGLAPWLLQPAA